MHRMIGVAGLFAVIASSGLALDWKSTVAEARTVPFQATIELAFEFRNASPRPVAIRDLQANCDCLTVASDKRVYEPGEAGRISARFTVGDRFGLYERNINVVTDEAPAPTRLTVRVVVPDLASVTPRTLDWNIGSPAAEQSVTIVTATNLWIDFNEATATNGLFSARLETVESGRSYRLLIKPATTAAAANGAIRVRGKDRSGRPVLVNAYANVR